MSTLKIAYFDITRNAVKLSSNRAEPTSFLYTADQLSTLSLGSGRRSCYAYHNVNPATWTYDLGSGFATKQNKIEYMYLSNAKMLQNSGITAVALKRSTDNVTYSSEFNITSFGSASLTGSTGKDYYTTKAESLAYRYWRIEVTGSADFRMGKAYFGKLFNFTYDPDYRVDKKPSYEALRSSSGARWAGRLKNEKYRISLDFNCLPQSDINSFNSLILEQAHSNDFVLIASSSDILDSKTAIHCKLVSSQVNRRTLSIYDLSTEWEQADG